MVAQADCRGTNPGSRERPCASALGGLLTLDSRRQKCNKLQLLNEFTGEKRTCTEKLIAHNVARRCVLSAGTTSSAL